MNLAPIKAQLWQRRHAIATLWQEALAEFQNHTYPDTPELFAELVEKLITILVNTPFNPQAAQAIGQTLAQTHHAHPDLLVHTQTILGQEFVNGLRPEQMADLYPRLLQLSNQFLTGYGEFAYGRILTDQEKISEKLTAIQQQAQLLSGEQDNTLQTILNLLAKPVILHDGSHVLTANPAAYNMLAYQPESLSGKPILLLFTQWAQKNLDQVLNATTIVPYETAVSTQDGATISIQFYNLPFHYQQREIYVLLIHEWVNGASTPPIHLTRRETEVLHLLAADHDDETIAEMLGIAPRTVKYHLQNAQKKLQVSSRAAAIYQAWEYALLPKLGGTNGR